MEKGIMLRMSRAQLHQLIWSQPMTEIARAYGVRGQHIANACDEHEIARPPAGYWQKLEYGKAVESVALDNSNYTEDHIVIIKPVAAAFGRAGRNDIDRRTAAERVA